jgi:hypothetical protein
MPDNATLLQARDLAGFPGAFLPAGIIFYADQDAAFVPAGLRSARCHEIVSESPITHIFYGK